MERTAPSTSRRHRASPKGSRAAARALYSAILLLCVVGAYALFADSVGGSSLSHPRLKARGVSLLHDTSSDCRLVHNVDDQCAYVRENCPDEEAGMFSYLSLYYCHLPHLKPVAFLILVLWLVLLFSTIGIAASDFFCVNLSTISSLLGMSESMAGVTFLALGNGSPDVFSTFAAMNTNSGSLAVGELVGAAGFITAVVAGSMAIVRPFKVARRSFIRDVGFFLVAASFSMVFLYDGRLFLWECMVMVGFYIFYVLTVLVWHWRLERNRKRRLREAAARAHFAAPGAEEAEVFEAYRDEEDGDDQGQSPQRSRATSVDAIASLERQDSHEPHGERAIEDDEEEHTRERWLGELSSSMRLRRPRMRSRRSTQNAIRPSLVGALEFRAVLSSLQKARNIQAVPIGLHRYTDEPSLAAMHDPSNTPVTSDVAARPRYVRQSVSGTGQSRRAGGSDAAAGHVLKRTRAVSMNDADRIQDVAESEQPQLRRDRSPSIDLLGPLLEDDPDDEREPDPPSLATSTLHSRSPSPELSRRNASRDRLQPPDRSASAQQARPHPRLSIPSSDHRAASPPSPFPAYLESFTSSPHLGSHPPSLHLSPPPSIRLPPPSQSPSSLHGADGLFEEEDDERPLSCWPYTYLPGPQLLLGTLFPTLFPWRGKNLWEKFLGIISAPSVLLLTLTLPVVEAEKDDEGETSHVPEFSISPPKPSDENGNGLVKSPERNSVHAEPNGVPSSSTAHSEENSSSHDAGAAFSQNIKGHGAAATVPTSTDAHLQRGAHPPSHGEPLILPPSPADRIAQSPHAMPVSPSASTPKQWNRWLVIVQIFSAPLFVVFIAWGNMSASNPSTSLLRAVLIALLCSLVLLAILLSTTSDQQPPRWRPLLCFAGFVVAIAWISTIANEVVGVLKTIGVVVDISDAILGLTIFAVGNSLGDLVADITVARLGFPVMALSACFGGPLLNILLGIGISGCYITIRGAKDRHGHSPTWDFLGAAADELKPQPYHIDVGRSLAISGITLLITLAGLLIAVPARGWRMDRVIGWGLVALWVTSTIGNVVLEAVGGVEGLTG